VEWEKTGGEEKRKRLRSYSHENSLVAYTGASEVVRLSLQNKEKSKELLGKGSSRGSQSQGGSTLEVKRRSRWPGEIAMSASCGMVGKCGEVLTKKKGRKNFKRSLSRPAGDIPLTALGELFRKTKEREKAVTL